MKGKPIHFTCPLPPSVNNYKGMRVVGSGRNSFIQFYLTTKAKQFKFHMQKLLEREVIQAGWEVPGKDEYIICEVVIYFKKRGTDGDNIFKCLLDSFTEVGIILDDSMVIPRVSDIFIDPDNPRVEVTLRKSEKRGVFPNQQELDSFKNKNCDNCRRFKRNCSLLKKSLENKIVPEVNSEELKCEVCSSD